MIHHKEIIMKLTAEILRRIAKSTPNANIVALVADGVDIHGVRFGIDQPHRMAHYLANVALESGGFTRQTENLNYTNAQRIYDVFRGPSKNPRFKSITECQPYVRNPEKLANKVYGNRMGENLWSFLATVWFWDVNDCNRYADRSDPENLRRVINGGLNGCADVLAYYDRAALVLLGTASMIWCSSRKTPRLIVGQDQARSPAANCTRHSLH